MFSKLNTISNKKRSTLAGILILTAYLMLITEVAESAIVGFGAEVISGLSVIGIALLLYPLFEKEDKFMAQGYLAFRVLEGLLMLLTGVFVAFGNYEAREFVYSNLHIFMFIGGALLMYILFYRTKLVPRFISIWGFIAVFFLSLTTILGWFNVSSAALNVTLILIITNEVFLAIWLMTKGLNVRGKNLEKA